MEERDSLAEQLVRYRPQLTALAARHFNPLLQRVADPEDMVAETLSAACQRPDFFTEHPEVPVYCKLRTLLLHVLADWERRYLRAQKRDICKEIHPDAADTPEERPWSRFADSVTGPFSHVARQERVEVLRRVVAELDEIDRSIIELSSFDGMSYEECAAVLNITPKAAGLRYLRALQRLKRRLAEHSLFLP